MKKHSKYSKSAICLMIMLCLALNFVPIFTMSVSAEEPTVDMGEISQCAEAEETIYFDSDNLRHFSQNEIIHLTYTLFTDYNIVEIRNESVGFNVLSIEQDSENEEKINLELSCDSTIESCLLVFDLVLSDGSVISSALYGLNNAYGTFISYISEEIALHEYLEYMVKSGRMTEEESRSIKNEYSNQAITETHTSMTFEEYNSIYGAEAVATVSVDSGISTYASSAGSGDTTVVAYLDWTEDNGAVHPLKNVKVEIYDKDTASNTLLATLISDDNGKISYSFDNPDGFFDFENGGYDIFIKVYPGDDNIQIRDDSNELYLYDGISNVIEDVETGEVQVIDFVSLGRIRNDDSKYEPVVMGQVFQVSQALITARNYAQLKMGTMPTAVNVIYPSEIYIEATEDADVSVASCFYSSTTKTISLCGTAETGSPILSVYESWDVIMHEYGHHLQEEINISDYSGGDHEWGDNNAVVIGDKYEGMALAWGEAWPTVFGMVAQDFYYDNGEIAYVSDGKYDAYNIIESKDVENMPISYSIGQTSETAIIGALWDMYDSGTETHDTLYLGLNWWDVTTGGECVTFSEFINYYYSQYTGMSNRFVIGKILSHFGMAPNIVETSCSNGNSSGRTPYIVFKPGGSGTVGEYNFENDEFIVAFYDDNYNHIYQDIIYTNTYTASASQWQQIIDACTEEYTVCVFGCDTDDFGTVFYCSEAITYPIP